MIRNIIFDMGNVLTEFSPEYFVSRLALVDQADQELLLQEIFRSEEWSMLDQGALDEKELERRVLARLPKQLHAAAHRLIFEWDQVSRPIGGMKELVRDCKTAGLSVYLLSNASVRQPEYWRSIPGSEYFDGTVVSAFCRCVKPEQRIFQHTLEKFGLRAEQSLFVDDVQTNVDGAVQAGMHGFRFQGDPDALRKELQRLGTAV